MKDFVNLRVFSSYSIFESTVRIPDLINTSKEMNFSSVVLCDRMNLFGAVEFSNYAISNGLKPIIGCLLKIESFGYLPVYVKNKKGYKELSYTLTQYYIRKEPMLFLDDLKEMKNCVCLSGGIDSVFYSSAEDKKEKLLQLQSIFKNDFYIEIQDLHNKNVLLRLASDLNIPIVVTSPVFHLREEESENLYVLNKVKNFGVYDESEAISFSNNFLRSKQQIQKIFKGLEEGIINTIHIAKKCSFHFEYSKPLMPTFCDDEDELLTKVAYGGLKKRIGDEVPRTYLERLEKEISLLKLKKFSGYFLLTSDFVKYAKSQGIPVGPGRGSGAGSLVAYVMEITDIDPIKYNLIFERFLNPEREAIPDFDIDYCPEGRKKVIEYITRKYGTYNVVNIITFGKMQAKAVVRDVCKVFGIPFSVANNITNYIPQDQINPVTLQQALDTVEPLKKYLQDPKFKKIFDIALKLEGIPRNISKHAAGVIISDNPLFEVCPLYRDEAGEIITQFDLKSSEQVGCVKFDFLGLKTLTIIKKTLELVEENYNKKIEFNSIPVNDKKTFERICLMDLEGIFQFEKIGVREVIHKMQPTNIEDLIAINALYRPGPIKNIPSYILRKKGLEKVIFPHPSTAKILESTYGIIVYQEQVMDIARVCAGYTLAEADLLRRAMGKKKHSEMIAHQSKFMNGCAKNNIEDKIAIQLFNAMREFSGYGFNKSHAAPYALISYVCAYLKTHYPLEFICSSLSLEKEDEMKLIKFIYNLKSLNIDLLAPCVNESSYNFSISEQKIRYGISAIKNVGEKVALEICQQSPYTSLENFLSKNKNINKKSWEALVLSGAMDTFNVSRKILIENLSSILKGEYQNNMFSEQELQFNTLERYIGEQKAFGFFISNPFRKIRDILSEVNCISISNLLEGSQKQVYIAGELFSFTVRRKISQKGGSSFVFLEMGDESSIIDITVFENTLKNFSQYLKEKSLLIVEVIIQRENGFTKLIAKSFYSPDEFLNALSEPLYLNLYNEEQAKKLSYFLKEGEKNIYVNFEDTQLEIKNVKYSLELLLEMSNICVT